VYSFYQESLERDEIEELNLRSITSSGAGYRFIETNRLKYKSEIGPFFTYERFRDNILQTSAGLRIGNYLDWQVLPSTLFYFKVDYLPVLEDFIDWRLESDMGLRHKLTKSLSLNLNWINQYDNKTTAENVSNNDATILSTLGYNF
jgi:putative salt-induced outer membrane protein YdiY